MWATSPMLRSIVSPLLQVVMIGKGVSRPDQTQIGDAVKNGNDHQTNQMSAPITCTEPVTVGKPGPHQTKSTDPVRRHCEKSGKAW